MNKSFKTLAAATFGAATAMVSLSTPASAFGFQTYSLNANFGYGGTATGSFDFNPDNGGTYQNISITTTPATEVNTPVGSDFRYTTTYDAATTQSSASALYTSSKGVYFSETGIPVVFQTLALQFGSPLTGAPGDSHTLDNNSLEYQLYPGGFSHARGASGSVVAAVPEPAEWGGAGVALGLGWLMRKKIGQFQKKPKLNQFQTDSPK